MLERENYDSKSAKLLPLSTRGDFSWMEWKAFLFIYARTILLGIEVLTMNVSLLVETAAAKTARILKYSVANGIIIFAICQSAFGCPDGGKSYCDGISNGR